MFIASGLSLGWFGLGLFRRDVLCLLLIVLLFRVRRICYLVLLDIKLGLDMITFSRLVFFFSQSVI